MTSSKLDPQRRRESLDRMAGEELDLLIVGGGVVGTGAALDAVTRGLTVGLVEARDYAAGTSSRSSKLIHGGLRYLEQRNFRLVREALRERSRLLKTIAPHLVHPVPFLFPLHARGWERLYIGSGVLLYDTIGGAFSVPHHRHLTRTGALRLAPDLREDAMVGAIQYHDAQVDDARHTVAVARTAARFGAWQATRTRVVGFLRDGQRVTGVRIRDEETGEEAEVRARVTLSATGVWTNDLDDMLGGVLPFHVRASKGIHFTVPRDRFISSTGLILRTEKSVLFVIPWGRHWLIGTTDTDWTLDRAEPSPTRADVDYLLERVNAVLKRPLTHQDIEGVYAGLRPLVSGKKGASTAALSREHALARPVPGLVVIAGGKYTTYREMAEDAIDAVGEELGGGVPHSVTGELPLQGAVGYAALRNSSARLTRESGLAADRIEHLLGRYGADVEDILSLAREEPALGQPLPGADEYLAAEVRYAATHEGALHLEDVLARRVRLSFEAPDRGVAAAETVAEVVAGPLGWDAARQADEVERYRSRVEAELRAEDLPGDEEANEVRRQAAGPVEAALA